jgi:hypothetical protein
MKDCYLEKWFLAGSVFYALFSSNPTDAQVVGDTTLPIGERWGTEQVALVRYY